MFEKKIYLALVITLSLVILSGLASASTTITDTGIGTSGNLTLGQKITFTLGEVVDNIIDGWITVTGNFNVTGNATVAGTSFKVNNKEVCLADGTNCAGSSDSVWNLTGSRYLYNNSNILELNDTKLNATIDARDSDTTYSHLSNFTDDLGNRGYTNNLNFTNGAGYYNATDFSIGDYYLKSNPFSFYNSTTIGTLPNTNNYWNDTFATFNKTFADTLYADISVVDTDTQKNATGYLYNDSTTIYLNDTKLNATIDARDSDTTYNFQCSTGQFVKNLTSTGGYVCDTPAGGSGYVSLYSSGNFNGSLYTTGADSTASNSNSIFQVIGSDGTPRFQVQNGGDGQASFVAKSFLVVNQNSTRLNQSQNNLCSDWGFAQIDCNSSTTGADMGVQDDFEVGGLIYANQGMSSNTPDWGSYLFLGNLTTYASGGTNGTFTDASNTFCDIISNPFTQEQVGNGTWIQITDGNYEGAMADMKVFINSSCVRLAGNPSWINNLTNQTFRILPRPVQIVTDGGYSEFYVGPGLQGKFEVNVENGSDLYGMHLDDTAGKSQHKAMVVDIDAGNNTGIVGENIFLTSSGGSFLDLVGLLMEVNPINLDNSDYSHFEFHNLAPLGTNNIRLMDIFGSYSELMRHGGTEVIDYVGYYNGATLTNITTNATSSSLNMEIFSNDNDELYFCDSNNLSEISVNLQTPSSADLALNYFYYASDGTWKPLSATDTTGGFTISGSIRWATPSDINLTTTDMNANSIGASYYCIVLQRTRNNVVTAPIESLFSASGSVQFLLRDDLIKLNPVPTPPLTCDALNDGAIYYDSDVKFHCSCKSGTGWVQMNDYTTACS